MATDSIKILKIEPCENPQFIRPRLITYVQNGIEKTWEVANTHDSVSILLYHDDQDAFILVKQFRPAIYLHNNDGYTHELCAGLVDKDKDIVVIAQEEILEECDHIESENSIKVLITHLRKIGFDIENKKNVGYRLKDIDEKVNITS